MPKFPFTNYHELNLDWILKKVTALFDASEENAQTIRTYETRLTSAEQTATSAATAATAAQQLADAASENADSALSVAGTADSKADSALTAATNAADAVAGALTTAQEAQQTAASAVATANDAAATASSLESLANTANQNATAALETAQTADQKAVAAQSAAATADQKAVAAQSTATTNAGNITTLQTDVSNLNRQTSDIENKINDLVEAGGIYIEGYEQGTIDRENGTNIDTYPNVRIRTPGFIPIRQNMNISLINNEVIVVRVCIYDSDKNFVACIANDIYLGATELYYFDISEAASIYPSAKYVRVGFRFSPERTINASEGNDIVHILWDKLDNREEERIAEIEQIITKYKIPLDDFLNAAYFRMSDNTYIKYTSQTDTYGLYKAVPVLSTETEIHIKCSAVNTYCAKIAFLNSSTFATTNIVGLWTNSETGEFDVSIPSGTKYVCIANECTTTGVVVGNPEAYFLLKDVYNAIVKNRDDITELGGISSYESLTYTDRFNSQRRDAFANTITKLKAGTLNYTILGDSITDTWDGHNQAGGGATDASHGYAKIVYRWLKQKYGNNIQFTNNGTGGITVTGTMDIVDNYIENQGFDLCIIELGTNDWNVQTSISTFKTNYKALLDKILAYTNAPEIFIIGLGYFGDWKSERAIKDKQYNEALREIAEEYNIPFADPYDGMKEEINFGTYTFTDITYAPDPVHPNDIGHRIWANEVYNVFSEIMK